MVLCISLYSERNAPFFTVTYWVGLSMIRKRIHNTVLVRIKQLPLLSSVKRFDFLQTILPYTWICWHIKHLLVLRLQIDNVQTYLMYGFLFVHNFPLCIICQIKMHLYSNCLNKMCLKQLERRGGILYDTLQITKNWHWSAY